MRYRGVARQQQAARARRADAERDRYDTTAPAAQMTAAELTASIYRLQSRRSAAVTPRIRELVAEQARRWEEQA